MIFLYDEILYLLIIPLIFFIFSFKTDKKDISNLFSSKVIDKVRVSSQTISRTISYRLFTLVSILFILALASPVLKEDVITQERRQTSLIVAVDISKSMSKTDVYPNRLDLAKQKLSLLVKQNHSMDIGVILFTEDAYSLFPISDDMEVLSYMIKYTNFHTNLGLGSNIFAALQAANGMLKKANNKNLLLLSDGGNSTNMSQELSYLKKEKIHLYAINIASKTHKGLEMLAQKSAGKYTNFSWGKDDIKTLIKDIEKNSKKEQLKKYQITQYKQLFVYPLGLAIVILFFLFNPNLLFFRAIQSMIIILIGFNLSTTPLEAGFLDFYYLHKANTLYENKNYKEAVAIFKTLDTNDEISYNLANALYKYNHYKEAIKEYKKILENKNSMNFKILHNIANAYVKLDKLPLAKIYYEKSLRINKNSLSKENLDEVIKILKKMKKLRSKKSKLPRNMSVESGSLADLNYATDSSYEVEIKQLLLSEEELWLKRLQNLQTPSFLQKIKTDKRSENAYDPW